MVKTNFALLTKEAAILRLFPRFFTGEPCAYGHLCERLVSNGGCVMCGVETKRRWRERNPEEARERDKRRRATPEYKELARVRRRLWERNNPDKVRAAKKLARQRYLMKDPVAYRKKRALKKKQQPSYIRKKKERLHLLRKYQKAGKQNRRVRLQSSPVRHTKEEFLDLFTKQDCRCAVCSTCLLISGYHKDHIIPLVLGGYDGIDNVQILCPPCSRRKGAKHPDEFAKELSA